MKAAAGLLGVAVLLIAVTGNANRAAHDPARIGSVLSALRSDLHKVRSDLAGEKHDIYHGATPSTGACYNLVNNVNNDVVRRLDHDAMANALFDRNWLTDDIAHMNTDIGTLRDDVRDFENDNVAHVSTERRALASLIGITARARDTADAYIKKINADVMTGYKLANRYRRAHRCRAGDQINTIAVVVPRV
jgi:hypothetical protein